MKRDPRKWLIGFSASVMALPALAHHSYAVFDLKKRLTVAGTVARFEWTNPHSYVWVYVPRPGSPKEHDLYGFENGPPTMMASLLLCLAQSGCAKAADSARLPGLTYESLHALPDWTGWWALRPVAENSFQASPAPMRPGDLARLRAARSMPDAHADPGRFCRPEQFVGVNVRPAPSIEFLFTPERVTLTNELGAVRRIYTDGRQLPADLEDSNMGTSIGQWEGQTLVVKTARINPEARFPDPNPGAIPIGRKAKVTERTALHGEHLDFDVVVTAPDILTAPCARRFSFARNPRRFRRSS
jgi:hypothetical protein